MKKDGLIAQFFLDGREYTKRAYSEKDPAIVITGATASANNCQSCQCVNCQSCNNSCNR